MFLIADAKRGDIGNTSEMYAVLSSIIENGCSKVAPYKGVQRSSVFEKDKWVIHWL